MTGRKGYAMEHPFGQPLSSSLDRSPNEAETLETGCKLPHASRRVARFDLGGVRFELVPKSSNKKLPGTSNARLSLGVPDTGQATRESNARGVATTPVREETSGLLCYFQDPDGNELCLWQLCVAG